MSFLPGAVTPTGFVPDEAVTLEKAEAVLVALVNVESACPWWIGDLLNWSEQTFGESWSQMLVPLTQVQWDTVRRYKQVAAAYPPAKRVEGATFSHHRELMLLPIDQRERWLARVVAENLSVREVKQLRYRESPDGEQKPPYPPDLLALIKQIGYSIMEAWDRQGRLTPVYHMMTDDGRLVTVSVTITKPDPS
jgi:hypothetical protein